MPQHQRTSPASAHPARTVLLVLGGVVAVLLGLTACLTATTADPDASASPRPTGAASRPVGDGPRDGAAAGHVPSGTTVFDERLPAVANLDPALRRALQDAATDAEDDGVTFVVNSGWRSRAYQKQLLREAVAQYGSAAEAARWVAGADTSSHVSGEAVDLAQNGGPAWLAEHGAAYGLCQVYGNEPWHYELRPEAAGSGCPAPYADPTADPRLRG
ncbi:M15 family metallopeptidase [Isoptericola sp. NPDC057653]|uniref:M15 family metallopeptidase n=1 Tax=Isoptericola sp. NPDC057653 TaxID=3346195 RepID=UPI0036B563EE